MNTVTTKECTCHKFIRLHDGHCAVHGFVRKQQDEEFDRIFEQLEAPEYPATCDQCGAEGTNASVEGHECAETNALQSLSALLKDSSYMTLPRARQIAIKHAHWNAITLPNNEFSLSWRDTKVLLDANTVLVDALKLFKAMDNCNYDLETMRRSGLFEQIDEALHLAGALDTDQISVGEVLRRAGKEI